MRKRRGSDDVRLPLDEQRDIELRDARIAIPGASTTANLLLRLFGPSLPAGEEMLYSEIMPAVARGEVDAGLIIHESRFTYPEHGLSCVVDLGAWWERETGAPIPAAMVVLEDARGARVTAVLADGEGRYRVRAPGAPPIPGRHG